MVDTSLTSRSFIPPRPGDIELSYVKIVNFDQSEVQNITLLVREFNIYESIYSNHLRADLVVEDALSLVTRMPIIGEEVVLIRFRTPSTAPETFAYDWIDLAMRVVRLDKMGPTNIRDAAYRLELVSYTQLINLGDYVSQSYGPSTISAMVKRFAADWLSINPGVSGTATANTSTGAGEIVTFNIEETSGDHQFTFPGLRPFDVLNFLANEAQSPKYIPSDFVFFETHKSYNFVTVSSLIDKPVKEQYYVFEQSRSPSDTPSQFTVTDFTSTNQKNPSNFRTMASISVEKFFDVETQLPGGLYDNTTIVIDPLLQQYDIMPANGLDHFEYIPAFGDFQKLAKGRPGQTVAATAAHPLIAKTGQISKMHAGPHMRLLPTNRNQTADYKVYPRKRQEFLSWLVSARQQMRSIVCNLTIPGDSDRVPGDLIYFELHEMGGTDDVIGSLNKYISGAYLITTVRHKYTHGASLPFITIIECVKNCFEAEVANDKLARTDNLTAFDSDAAAKAKALMEKISAPARQRL